MNSDMREVLINALTDSELEEVMEEMYLDDTVDVLEELPANVVDRLLLVTDEEKRKQINQLLQYPEDSAGSVMNVDYIALRREMTVADAILRIRQIGLNRETIYTCYVTEKKKLIGVVDVKELLTTSESKLIEEIMETNMLYAQTTDDQEDVARTITKYGLIALPIVDHEMCMVGIVTVDDAMLVLQEEETEDISIMAGVSPSDESYFGTTVFEHVKSRIPWLLFLMLSATVTQMIMNSYESALTVMPQLAGFVPMLTGTGGNCGSQSSTLVIRGLAVGEIELTDVIKVIWKEVRIAVCISVVLAVVKKSPIHSYTIKRMVSGYHDTELTGTYSSASAIRKLLSYASHSVSMEQEGMFDEPSMSEALTRLEDMVPPSCIRTLEDTHRSRYPIYANDFSLPLKYQLLKETYTSLAEYLDISEDLANRILNHTNDFVTFDQFCDLLKTRDVTYSRLSRSLLHILLGIKKKDLLTFREEGCCQYARILGFRKDAKRLLSYIKKHSDVPLITKLTQIDGLTPPGLAMLKQDVFASNLYESVITNKFKMPFVNEYQHQILKI